MSTLSRRGLLAAATLTSAGLTSAGLTNMAVPDVARASPAASPGPVPDPGDSAPRERYSLDREWRFHLGHAADPTRDFGFGADRATYAKSGDVGTPVATPDFDDSAWQAVRVPHDWAVDLPYTDSPRDDKTAREAMAYQGFKPLGRDFPDTSVGWYRRSFDLPASDRGRRLSLEFDGVARDCLVILNGFVVASNQSGYAPFRADITDVANYGGRNVLVVRADVSLGEAWSYEGAGLYRHVWLVKTAAVHIPQWGTRVRCHLADDLKSAGIVITTEIVNEAQTLDGASPSAAACRVISTLFGPTGAVLARQAAPPLTLAAGEAGNAEQTLHLTAPALWSLETPHLHVLVSEVEVAGRVVDRYRTPFGIRSQRFDPERGFFLNGHPVKIKGTCNHQDHAGVGFAVPDRLHVYRLEKLKEMGANAYRTTHNPAAPELLDACDRLGILVLEETRQMSSNPEGLSQLERMVRRDRNRPSIILWGVGNEEIHRGTEQGARIAATMKRLAHRLDGTRPVTEAFNGKFGQGASPVLDVLGCNYFLDDIDAFHAQHPGQPMIGTETASTVCTRGIYAHDEERRYVSAYDAEFPKWASTAERWWKFYDARPFLAGGFVWTGFDYRGEPTPFHGWPNTLSNFGIMDSCGFPKDNYYYYRSWWRPEEPTLHLFPHWNWAGREGQPVEVWCHSNLDAVELLLNGVSQGRRTVERAGHVAWTVPYAPGVIEAYGYRDGRRVLTSRRETTGATAALRLSVDRPALAADGVDVAVISVAVVDDQGRVVPQADTMVRFTARGDAALIGVGNGNPTSLEPDHAPQRRAFNGLCCALVQAGTTTGSVRVTADAEGLAPGWIDITLTPAKGPVAL